MNFSRMRSTCRLCKRKGYFPAFSHYSDPCVGDLIRESMIGEDGNIPSRKASQMISHVALSVAGYFVYVTLACQYLNLEASFNYANRFFLSRLFDIEYLISSAVE